jgi:hypothetical protein
MLVANEQALALSAVMARQIAHLVDMNAPRMGRAEARRCERIAGPS